MIVDVFSRSFTLRVIIIGGALSGGTLSGGVLSGGAPETWNISKVV